MAKKKTARPETTQPEWKTKWPRNGDLATWFRYMLRKCEAISDDNDAAERAHLPIEHLAELDRENDAIRWVNRFLKRLPQDSVLDTVHMAELGAKVSLNAGNLKRMEKYLAIAESTEPFNTRKCDRGFSINSVRDFRADNGILDPKDAVDDDQRNRAEFWGAHRRFKQALNARRKKQARQAVAEMEGVACKLKRRSRREQFVYFVVTSYAELQDTDAVKRCIRRLDKHDRDMVLDATTLLELGMKREAIARTKRDIAEDLEKLAIMDDPNIHFPAMSISRSLRLLFEQGETNSAKHWLRRALREMPTWPALEFGWSTSAVYNTFAEAVALIEGAEAAEQLLEQAMRDGHLEKRPGFSKAAINSAIDLKADMGRIEEAIEDARKLRSPKQRRKELGKLLARAGRWKELREVLCQVTSPEEAADVMWWIKFELPGGAVK
ncbi:hypothetical protein Q31b_58490 [Novipirellula aureliae]|uniref:Tetratricopeptide repeat protein n=1 Tax=Novipirellula aureliae TaxID=2527966 RepID=A0A5C6D8P2_9BACT|nr:hypothetical protein [Novipirellula aureliae]TWU32154.1 hypothetical protein Q31b_58490 [Novipirellula aureliae]